MSNIYNLTDTWTDVAVTYNAIKINVTDTASASGSLLANLQVAGAARFSVSKNGDVVSNLRASLVVAPTIASAATIAPTKAVTIISGVAAIVTITAPSPISATGGQITFIPTGVFTWTAAGNIALAGTAVVSRALTFTYDATTVKWYPSYI